MRDYKPIKRVNGKKMIEKEESLKDRVTKRLRKRITVLKQEMWDYKKQLEKGKLC